MLTELVQWNVNFNRVMLTPFFHAPVGGPPRPPPPPFGLFQTIFGLKKKQKWKKGAKTFFMFPGSPERVRNLESSVLLEGKKRKNIKKPQGAESSSFGAISNWKTKKTPNYFCANRGLIIQDTTHSTDTHRAPVPPFLELFFVKKRRNWINFFSLDFLFSGSSKWK